MADLNEENSTDIDDVSHDAVVHDDAHSIADDMGEQNSSEEPNSEMQMEHQFAMENQIEELKDRVKQLESSIRIFIDAGATIMEGQAPVDTGNNDNDYEQYIYLEDLDYSLKR